MTPSKRRVLAGGTTAAIVLALSGALIPTVATADEDATAPTSGASFDANAKQLLTNEGVEAVATNAEGQVVVYTTAAPETLEGEADAFVEQHSNVVVKVLDAPFDSLAETDVVGGAGYFAFDPADPGPGGLCSVGFSAWSPAGDPAFVSAGHCTDDGGYTASYLTLPSGDTAGGGNPNNDDVELTYALAELAFSQYGGPGNTPGASGDVTSTDVSTWDLVNPDLQTLPEVTNWTTSDTEDLSAATIPVRAVGAAVVNGAVTKSGRTTGFTNGQVLEVGGWANVSGRQVYGFVTNVASAEGDSGGAVFQGNTAVGILSGGTTQGGSPIMFAADLQNALSYTGGYTVALYLDAPVVTSTSPLGAGGAVTGTGPANSTLKVSQDGGAEVDVPVDGAGNWSFPAPEVGTYSYTAYAVSGFDSSETTTFEVEVVPAAPVFTSPANGDRIVGEVTEITGTGEIGATVTLTGDVTDDATVGEDGTWSVEVDLGIDAYSVTATQEIDGVTSASATTAFAVIPTAPIVDAPLEGGAYAFASAPTAATGTGIEDAAISVTLNGADAGSTTVADGAWSVPLTAQAGEFSLVVTQTVNGQSNSTTVAYEVAAAPATGGGSDSGAGSAPGSLANTGMSDPTPYVVMASALLLLGAALLMVRRMRTRNTL